MEKNGTFVTLRSGSSARCWFSSCIELPKNFRRKNSTGWFLRCGAQLCQFRQTLRKVSIGGTTPNIGSFSISRWARVQNRKHTSKLLMT